MKFVADMSPQSRSGGGDGMQTVGYAGSQFASAAVGDGKASLQVGESPNEPNGAKTMLTIILP